MQWCQILSQRESSNYLDSGLPFSLLLLCFESLPFLHGSILNHHFFKLLVLLCELIHSHKPRGFTLLERWRGDTAILLHNNYYIHGWWSVLFISLIHVQQNFTRVQRNFRETSGVTACQLQGERGAVNVQPGSPLPRPPK